MDEHTVYTHAEWRVAPGREEEFVAAALASVIALCDRATPGAYRRVAHVDLRNRSA